MRISLRAPSSVLTNTFSKLKRQAFKVSNGSRVARRLFRKAVQQGRSERRGESYSLPYVEPLSDARTPLADFVNSLLETPTGRQI